jgi:hypothetical protein
MPIRPLSTQIAAALAALEYDRIWLDAGIMSEPDLLAQLAKYERSVAARRENPSAAAEDPEVDTSTEHYRHRTIVHFLRAQLTLTDEQVDALLNIAAVDPDPALEANFPRLLLERVSLTDDQFERVAGAPACASFSDVILRYRCLRRLRRGEWSEDLVAACLTSDGFAQAELLKHPALTREAVEGVAARGHNTSVRNRAAEMLRSRRFREP